MRCKELSVLTMLGFSLLGLRSIRVLLWRLTEFRSDYEKSLALLSILMVCTAESKAQAPFTLQMPRRHGGIALPVSVSTAVMSQPQPVLIS